MTDESDRSMLPPKREVALALVQTAASVFIHLDPRPADVNVPSWFKSQPELVLQVGLNLVPPIVDLDIGQDALSATLSFNRRPEHCRIPWSAVWGLVGDDGRGMIWPESVPPEVAARAPGRGTPGRGASSKGSGAERSTRKSAGAHLRAAGPGSAGQEKAEPRKEPVALKQEPAGASSDRPPGGAAKGSASPGKRELPPYLRVVK